MTIINQKKFYRYIDKLTDPNGNLHDYLGSSVAISLNGNYIVSGSPADDDISLNAGALHVWKLNNGIYKYKQVLTDPSGSKSILDTLGGINEPGDYLGSSVAISDDNINIVGGAPYDDTDIAENAGSLHVFSLSGEDYIYKQRLIDIHAEEGDRLGSSVAISINGDYIVSGSPMNNNINLNVGAIHLWKFNHEHHEYDKIQILTDPSGEEGDN